LRAYLVELTVSESSGNECSHDTGIYEDLGLDSLQGFELIYVTEQLAGLQGTETGGAVPDSWLSRDRSIFTLGDAYPYYVELARETANP
jgi:hypothetical protein